MILHGDPLETPILPTVYYYVVYDVVGSILVQPISATQAPARPNTPIPRATGVSPPRLALQGPYWAGGMAECYISRGEGTLAALRPSDHKLGSKQGVAPNPGIWRSLAR